MLRHPLIAAILVLGFCGSALAQTVHCVPDTSPGGCDDSYLTIQTAVDHAIDNDTVKIAAGTYNENVTVGVDISFDGVMAGVDARGRAGSETIIAPASGTALTLVSGSAGITIDGLTFSGGSRGIESTSGPIDGVFVLNSIFTGFTGQAIFLNDPGNDITVQQNSIDGSSSTGGGLMHLDQDAFDGFQFLDNDVLNGTNGTGLFSDGNHNVGQSVNRSPRIAGNRFDNNQTGVNLGRFSFENGTIEANIFSNNGFDGLQGGIQGTAITGNVFLSNGRAGLRMTGFGGTGDSTRGAQHDSVTCNTFEDNGFDQGGGGGLRLDDQFDGTVTTNTINMNDISGNAVGLSILETVGTLDAEDDFWGDASGPTAAGNPGGTGDSITTSGSVVDFVPFATAHVDCAPGLPGDLSITKNSHPLTPAPGQEVFFDITLTNVGLGAVSIIEVTDLLDPDLAFIGATASQGSYDGGTGIWTVGSLAEGAVATLEIRAQVSSDASGQIPNTAQVTNSSPADPNSANDADTVLVSVAGPVPALTGAGMALLLGLLAATGFLAWRRRGSVS